MTAYSYIRWSSGRQTAGDSLRRQTETARTIATAHNWNLVDLPPDAGLSAFKGKNRHVGALGQFLSRIQNGSIEMPCVLIVEKLDRFSRQDVDEVLPLFINLVKAGVEVFSVIENEHYTAKKLKSDPLTSVLKMLLSFVAANQYSVSLSERVSRAKQNKISKAQAGQLVNLNELIPWYFDFDPVKGYSLNEKADIVRRIFNEYLDGFSITAVTRKLNKDNVPTFGNTPSWRTSTVRRILLSRYVLGEYKGVKYLPQVIPLEKFNRVQIRMKQNTQCKGRQGEKVNIFRRLIKCEYCGYPMAINSLKGNIRYYRCRGHMNGACGHKRFMNADKLDRDILFNVLQFNPKTLMGNGDKERQEKIESLEASLVDVEKRITKIVSVIDEVDDVAELTKKLKDLQNQRQSIKTEISELRAVTAAKIDVEKFFGSELIADLKKFNLPEPITGKQFIDLDGVLANDDMRRKIQMMMPNLISKITVDTDNQTYSVFNHVGEVIEKYSLTK